MARDVDGAARAGADGPPVGRFWDLAGRRIWLDRAGDGGPAVVVLPGAGAVGLDYFNVHERAARLTTSVLYDRSGTGWSGAPPEDRSAAATVAELRALLASAGVPAPYVLVGHSLGGLFARRFAQLHPAEVAGLVLLDPAHEDYSAYMPANLTAMRERGWFAWLIGGVSGPLLGAAVRFAPRLLEKAPVVQRYRELYRRLFSEAMAGWPAAVREPLVERHLTLEWLWAGMRDAQNAPSLYREVRAGGALPDVPMIVLSSSAVDEFRRAVSVGETDAMMAEELAAKRRLYEDFAATVARGEVRDVDAGHVTIGFLHPEAVERAIADILVR
jgi:pimeloyl-ACP methyl ester carboxylesterase